MSETINIEMTENRETICDDDETKLSIDLSEIKKAIAGNKLVENSLFFSSLGEDMRYISALALCCPTTTVVYKPMRGIGFISAMVFAWLDRINIGITGFMKKMIGGIKSNYKTGKNVLSLISLIRSMN